MIYITIQFAIDRQTDPIYVNTVWILYRQVDRYCIERGRYIEVDYINR